MRLSMRPHHLNRYREIATLLIRHGRSDLVRSAGLEDVLAEEEVGPGARRWSTSSTSGARPATW